MTNIDCPDCGRRIELNQSGIIPYHDNGSPIVCAGSGRQVSAASTQPSCTWCRAVCGFSGASIDGPGTKMGCDRCYCTLFVGERDTWPTVEQAVAAAHAAGWTGDARFSLCAECSKGGA